MTQKERTVSCWRYNKRLVMVIETYDGNGVCIKSSCSVTRGEVSGLKCDGMQTFDRKCPYFKGD